VFNLQRNTSGSVFGPLLFNIFFNDLLFIQLDCKISAYADDAHLFCIGKDSDSIYQGMPADLLTAARWFSSNGLGITLTNACIAMWLGNTRDNPSYLLDSQEISTVDEIKFLGVTIDKELNFNDHVTSIVRKVSNQLQVIKRHKRLIDTNSKVKLYNAYFLPQLNYCSIVWNFRGQRNSVKLDKLNERSLRFVYNDFNSTYEQRQPSLHNRRIHDMLALVYKSFLELKPPKMVYIHSVTMLVSFGIIWLTLLELPLAPKHLSQLLLIFIFLLTAAPFVINF
jgi:hypothetical protein